MSLNGPIKLEFILRPKDVGESKAIVAANYIMNRVPGCKVTPYVILLDL
jgi:molybdopterin/thiamine biosynthesis adenylyltransferase